MALACHRELGRLCVSINGKLCGEPLEGKIFLTLKEAEVIINNSVNCIMSADR
jgi:hypothetical protein